MAITGSTAAGICEFLNSMMDQVTDAKTQHLQTKIIDLNFAAPDEKITSSTPINQESLLSRPIKNKHGFASRQQSLKLAALRAKARRRKIGNE